MRVAVFLLICIGAYFPNPYNENMSICCVYNKKMNEALEKEKYEISPCPYISVFPRYRHRLHLQERRILGKKVLSLFVFNIPGCCSKGQAIEPAQYASKFRCLGAASHALGDNQRCGCHPRSTFKVWKAFHFSIHLL